MNSVITRHIKALLLIVVSIATALVCLAPAAALAKDYSMPQVDQDVTITKDGSIHVVEIRTFDFDGQFSGVYWQDSTPRGSNFELKSVSEVLPNGSLNYFKPVDEDNPSYNSYALTLHDSTYLIGLMFNKENTKTAFRIEYVIHNAVTAYADVAELYWKFIGPAWEKDSQNVTTRFHFETSPEEIKAGENVHAYGHGSLNGNIEFAQDGIVYKLPYVNSGQFAEARILFPLSFVPKKTPGDTEKYQEILNQEKEWAQITNKKRAEAKLFYYGKSIALIAVVGLLFLYTLRNFFKYGKEYKPEFQGKYFREKPSELHPAILGAFWRGGSNTDDFSASLLRLSSMGYIDLEKRTQQTQGLFGSSFGSKIEDDYILYNKVNDINSIEDPIDKETMRLLFTVFAKGKDSLRFSDIKRFAKTQNERYIKNYQDWFETVNLAKDADFYEEESSSKKFISRGILILCFILVAVAFASGISTNIPITIISLVIAVVLTIAIGVMTKYMDRKTKPATELHAKLGALRNWLEDFTLLNEAPPTHVKVWKELIVMAVVLGVADKVIAQLKTTMPQILEDPQIMPMTMWYVGDFGTPMNSLNSTFTASKQIAQTIAAQELAQSVSSSDWGGGGGFSIGGGGGFGGGGGGAF